MPEVIYIRRREFGRVQAYDPSGFEPSPGEVWIVESERGVDYGSVVNRLPEPVSEGNYRLIRKASPEDLAVIAANRVSARDTFRVCQEKISAQNLEMKLVAVEYSFDRSRLLFYFTSEGRIDFRELVRDLAGIFRTRIEMRQIGVRDEARMMGGIGPCGREICCAGFLHEFDPINIRMAKSQRLSLDPEKISGICGRLFCCLKYEDAFYQSCRKLFPKEGTVVETEQGEGKVVDWNCVRSSVTVALDDGRKLTFPVEKVKRAQAADDR